MPKRHALNTSPKKLSRRESVYRAACEAASEQLGGDGLVTSEEIVLAAWRRYPKYFGLRGYEETHPDSHRVLCYLMGKKGLVGIGKIRKVGAALYRIGGQEAESISTEMIPPSLGEEDATRLLGVLRSVAMGCHQSGRRGELTFEDALHFWEVLPGEDGAFLKTRLDRSKQLLERAGERADYSGEFGLPGGRVFTDDDAEELRKLDDYLRARYARQLTQLLKTKERALAIG